MEIEVLGESSSSILAEQRAHRFEQFAAQALALDGQAATLVVAQDDPILPTSPAVHGSRCGDTRSLFAADR